MASKEVYLPEIGKIALTKRRSSKNIKLSYSSDGIIKVSLPIFVPYQAGINFVIKNQAWLEDHRPGEQVVLEQGDRIGKAHRLNFAYSDKASRPSVRVTNTQINVSVPLGHSFSGSDVQTVAIRGAHKALSKEASQLLPQRLDQLAKANRFEYQSVKAKRLTTRWGSCSNTKEIILNIYLMQLPWDLIDYVIIHELVHTEHMNHSISFWQRFEQILFNAKALRKRLKQYQTKITPIKI